MVRYRTSIALIALLATWSIVGFADAAGKAPSRKAKQDRRTTIFVKGIHCPFCASKLSKKLKAIPGIASAKVDAKKGTAIMTPKDAAKLPSPRAQWEAVEKAGYKPVKMTGPFGTFRKKPDANVGLRKKNVASSPRKSYLRSRR